jgi:hypothetical protein
VCSARAGSHSPLTPPQNYPPDWERRATQHFQTRRVIRRLPPSTFKPFRAGHTRPTVRSDVGRVCSARVGSNSSQTRSQNYPPDWERRATPTFPNQAGNPAFTFMSIRAFFAPDTPALRLAGCRAGVFCASGIEFTPDTTAELPAGLGTPRHPNASKPAGNPAFTFMSIRAFFAPDTPALRLVCLSRTSLKRLTIISAWLESSWTPGQEIAGTAIHRLMSAYGNLNGSVFAL